MKRLLVLGLVLATMATATAATANHTSYLPLQKDNSWTYLRSNPVVRFAPWTIKVDRQYGIMNHLDAFPGFGDVWMAWSGNSVYTWSWEKRGWVRFLRFDLPAGSKYTVELGHALWSKSTVTVKGKGLKLDNPHLGMTHTNVVHFTFTHVGLADAGVGEYYFAPGYGLVKWTEQSFTGPTTGWLGAGVVGGKKIGPMTYELLESGQTSNYLTAGEKNVVLLINSQAAWERFYDKHNTKLGADVPKVDFTRQTVVVVLAGQRTTGGYTVKLSGAWYDYPTRNSVRLKVTEVTPAGPVTMALTQPYAIYVLDGKAYSGSKTWDVILNR